MPLRVAAPLVLAALLFGCSSSSSTDADAGDSHDGSKDAGADSFVAQAGFDSGPVFTIEAGTTWSSLYRDYFGPAGQASCAGDGNCHGSVSEPGYARSHFLCPTDGGLTQCYAGMTSLGDGGANLVLPAGGFSADELNMILCQDDGNVGVMPLECSYIFTPIDIERIADWVNAGAQDN